MGGAQEDGVRLASVTVGMIDYRCSGMVYK